MYRKLKSTELQENELKTPNATQSSMIPLKLYTNATLSIPKAVEITRVDSLAYESWQWQNSLKLRANLRLKTVFGGRNLTGCYVFK
jgi:hypothetical protein